jgi:hypothetical protein
MLLWAWKQGGVACAGLDGGRGRGSDRRVSPWSKYFKTEKRIAPDQFSPLPPLPRRHRLRISPQALSRFPCFFLQPFQHRISWRIFHVPPAPAVFDQRVIGSSNAGLSGSRSSIFACNGRGTFSHPGPSRPLLDFTVTIAIILTRDLIHHQPRRAS